MGVLPGSNVNQKCIDACTKCAQACYECFTACLNEPDVKERKNCISMLIECAGMCKMSACHMAMDGKFAADHCGVCATVCEACATECEAFNDNHCTPCAQICRDCAAECKAMASS